jgi:hypothetical protein
MSGGRTIRASEIGEYVYCHRAWWLRHVEGHASANTRQMEAGSAAHARHGWGVRLGGALRGLAALLLIAALLAALAAMVR